MPTTGREYAFGPRSSCRREGYAYSHMRTSAADSDDERQRESSHSLEATTNHSARRAPAALPMHKKKRFSLWMRRMKDAPNMEIREPCSGTTSRMRPSVGPITDRI